MLRVLIPHPALVFELVLHSVRRKHSDSLRRKRSRISTLLPHTPSTGIQQDPPIYYVCAHNRSPRSSLDDTFQEIYIPPQRSRIRTWFSRAVNDPHQPNGPEH
jgi:hypothetical protein